MSGPSERPVGPRIAFLVHGRRDLPGLLEVAARSLGLAVTVHHLHLGPDEFPAPRTFDGLVVLGSPRSVNDESVPWLAAERRLVGRAAEDDVPVLGVCFGGQLLAQVLGGRVRQGAQPEIGWRRLESDDPSLVDPGPWVVWHGEVFEAPEGADIVARTEVAPHAFVLGPHMGIQFHPEITPELLALWVEGASRRATISPEEARELTEGAERHGPRGPLQARRLLEAHLRRSGLWSEAP